jgi:AhpD family alkylhydroperoxidase
VKGNPTGDNSVKILLTVTTVSYTVSLLCKETIMHSAQPEPAMEMKRMFLPEVQDNPQASPYFDLVQSARNSGQEYWQVWHLFAFRAEITAHLARSTHGIMHEPSPLSSGLRELAAAYTSYVNECEFCTTSHVAIAAELLGSEDLVWGTLRVWKVPSSPRKKKPRSAVLPKC